MFDGKVPKLTGHIPHRDYAERHYTKNPNSTIAQLKKGNTSTWINELNTRRLLSKTTLAALYKEYSTSATGRLVSSAKLIRYIQYQKHVKIAVNFSTKPHPYDGPRSNSQVQTVGITMTKESALLTLANSLIDPTFLNNLLLKINPHLAPHLEETRQIALGKRNGWDSIKNNGYNKKRFISLKGNYHLRNFENANNDSKLITDIDMATAFLQNLDIII